MKLEAGKWYRRRDGEVVQIRAAPYPFRTARGEFWYAQDGRYYENGGASLRDLIEEVPGPDAPAWPAEFYTPDAPKPGRRIKQVFGSDAGPYVLCDDDSMWWPTWAKEGVIWTRFPPIPQDDE